MGPRIITYCGQYFLKCSVESLAPLTSSTSFVKASTARCDVKIMPPYLSPALGPISLCFSKLLTTLRPSSRSWCSRTGTNVGAKLISSLKDENCSAYPSWGVDFVFRRKIGTTRSVPVAFVLIVVTSYLGVGCVKWQKLTLPLPCSTLLKKLAMPKFCHISTTSQAQPGNTKSLRIDIKYNNLEMHNT